MSNNLLQDSKNDIVVAEKTLNDEENEDYDVEKVLDMKILNNVRFYLLKWIGYRDECNTWEPERNLNCENLITDYLTRRKDEQIDKILGVTTKKDQKEDIILYFVVEYKYNHRNDLIPVAQAYQRWPRLVIKFFEDRLQWKQDSNLNKIHYLQEEEINKMRAKTHNFRGGFNRNLVPEAICGVTNSEQGLLVLLKWQDHDLVELCPAHELHQNCPELLLNFYNDRIDWKDSSYYTSSQVTYPKVSVTYFYDYFKNYSIKGD